MNRLRPCALAALVLLAGCSSGNAPAGGSPSTAAAPPATGSPSTTAPRSPTGPPSATGSPSATASPSATGPASGTASPSRSAAPVLVLQPDGLGVAVGDARIRQLPFAGTPAAQVRTAVAAALGPLTVTPLPECGQGARTSAARRGFSVLLDGTRFVGWTDQGAPGRRLTTADGIGVGSTLAALRRTLGAVEVTAGSLGPEWNVPGGPAGGLSGVLDGTAATSRVTVISAGETCFFR